MPAAKQVPDLSRRSMLGRVPAAALATTAILAALPAQADESELLRLGRKLDLSWAREKTVIASFKGDSTRYACATIDAALDRTSDIVHQIEVLPATSLAGLKVKARAVLWCHSGEPFEPDAFNEQTTTDVRIVASIMNDILAL